MKVSTGRVEMVSEIRLTAEKNATTSKAVLELIATPALFSRTTSEPVPQTV
jgi:hypothetical protein